VNNLAAYEDAVKFHGHTCPGLAIGYRVAAAAMREIAEDKSEDEEIVVIAENRSCSFDAIQLVCGCTFGKGNIILRDYGKHAYTFFNRNSGNSLRIYIDPYNIDGVDGNRFLSLRAKKDATETEIKERQHIKKSWIEKILTVDEEKIMKFGPAIQTLPDKAMILGSVECHECHEKVMSSMIRRIDGRGNLCLGCV